MAERRAALTTGFLSWLGDQAAASERTGDVDAAEELEALGGRVLALCDTCARAAARADVARLPDAALPAQP